MHFRSEAELRSHVLGQLIPFEYWRDIFEYELDESSLQYRILGGSLTDLLSLNEKDIPTHQDKKKYIVVMLCALDYSDIDLLKMIAFILSNTCKNEACELIQEIFILSCWSGRCELIHNILSDKQVLCSTTMIAFQRYCAFRFAVLRGHLDVVKTLIAEMPEKIEEMLSVLDCYALTVSASNDHLHVFKYLMSLFSDRPQKQMQFIDAKGVYFCESAISNGSLDFLKYIDGVSPGIVSYIIRNHAYKFFLLAVSNGHVHILRYFRLVMPELFSGMPESDRNLAFESACINGHVRALLYLSNFLPDSLSSVPRALIHHVFCFSAMHGRLNVLRFLFLMFPSERHAMLLACKQYVFEVVCSRGHIQVFDFLIENMLTEEITYSSFLQPRFIFHQAVCSNNIQMLDRFLLFVSREEVKRILSNQGYLIFKYAHSLVLFEKLLDFLGSESRLMIEASSFMIFHAMMLNKRFDVVKKIVALTDEDTRQSMLESSGFQAFHGINNVEILDFLVSNLSRERVQKMIEFNDFSAFHSSSHIDVLRYFVSKVSSSQLQAMLAARDFTIFRSVHDFDTLNFLIDTLEPGALQAMIEYDNFAIFRSPKDTRVADLLMHLVAKENLSSMISARNYEALTFVVARGDIETFNILMNYFYDCGKWDEVIQCRGTFLFKKAVEANRLYMAHFLLNHPIIFAYAEARVIEYGHIVDIFLEETLSQLPKNTAQMVFETSEQARLYFFILRNLIRRHDLNMFSVISHLISIPAVQSILHLEITKAHPNELYSLAVEIGYTQVISLLLTIPSIRDLVGQNPCEPNVNALDLSAFACDPESSMRALTVTEQNSLSTLISYYHPFLLELGSSFVIEDLKACLEERFKKNPAVLVVSENEKLDLPLTWDEYQALNLSSSACQLANQAYHAHREHTVWRYLSKPNFWMSPHALYVNRDEHDENMRWSTFEDYQDLIAIFYLAAKDEKAEPSDGFTIETRLNHFFEELALIGRAHNWDVSRDNFDEGDKPSCYSGVKRRLFQSLQGHHLFKNHLVDEIKAVLQDFVRDHFIECLDGVALSEFKIIQSEFEAGHATHDCFQKFHISAEKQTELIDILKEKYGVLLDSEMENYVRRSFILNDIYPSHVARFAGEVHFVQLLFKKRPIFSSSSSSPDATFREFSIFQSRMLTSRNESDSPSLSHALK